MTSAMRWSRVVAGMLVAATVVVLVACASDEGLWTKAQKADTIAAYQEYLRDYPQGKFATQARTRVVERELSLAEAAGTEAALEAFLASHPDSPVRGRADEQLAQLRFASAESAGTADAYAAFLKQHPGSALAAKARSKRSELLFKFRSEVTARQRVQELSGFLGSWSVRDREKHVGLVFRVAFEFLSAGGDLPTHELALAYNGSAGKAEVRCSGTTMGSGSEEGGGTWIFNDLDAGQSFSMKIRKAGREVHSIVFAVPNNATDLVVLYKGEPLTGAFQLAQFPQKDS